MEGLSGSDRPISSSSVRGGVESLLLTHITVAIGGLMCTLIFIKVARMEHLTETSWSYQHFPTEIKSRYLPLIIGLIQAT